jgi:hypothetical protein
MSAQKLSEVIDVAGNDVKTRMRSDLVAGEWEVQVCLVWNGDKLRRCQACNQANIRYIHRLRHRETAAVLEVGIACCGVLIGNPDLAQRLENEVKRKLGWREHYGTTTWRPCAVHPEDVDD